MNEKELDLLENIINIAIGECPVEDTPKIVALERKIKSFVSLCKTQKEVIDKAIFYINENKDKYYKDWSQDDGGYDTYLSEDEIKQLLNILKEVSE